METTELTELLRAMDAIRPHVNQTMNYYAPIGQQIAHVDRIDAHFDRNMGMSVEGAEADCPDSDIPECLKTEKATQLKQKLMDEQMVDENWQPQVSRTQSALVADFVAQELCIRDRWQTFEKLWGRSGMRADYNRALGQKQSLGFQQRLKNIFR